MMGVLTQMTFKAMGIIIAIINTKGHGALTEKAIVGFATGALTEFPLAATSILAQQNFPPIQNIRLKVGNTV